jgi:hypothetical protein
MREGIWPKRAWNCKHKGRRLKGRPKKRWKGGFKVGTVTSRQLLLLLLLLLLFSTFYRILCYLKRP